jgi:hypothetical protein
MLRDLIASEVRSQHDMELVVPSTTDLLAAAEETAPDFVVLGLGDAELPADCDRLLAAHPACKVLGIQPREGSAVLYELVPRRRALREVSPAQLVEEIRKAGEEPLFPLSRGRP